MFENVYLPPKKPQRDIKQHWDLLIFTKTGWRRALTAAEYGLIRMRMGPKAELVTVYADIADNFSRRGDLRELHARSIAYKIAARNCIEAHIDFNHAINLKTAIRKVTLEIGARYISFIKEDTPMIYF